MLFLIRRQKKKKKKKLPPEEMQIMRQMFAQIMKNLNGMAERMDQRFERMEQRLTNIERSDRCSERKCSVETQELFKKFQTFVIELPMEFLTLFLTEQVTKPDFQLSEPTILQPLTEPTSLQFPPLVSEPLTPNVARFTKKHRFKHRVIERIGFRSYPSVTSLCYRCVG